MHIEAVILAAGRGRRMHSRTPKSLQTLGGKPLLAHILQTLRSLGDAVAKIHIVIAPEHRRQFSDILLTDILDEPEIQWVEQAEPEGTGAAVLCALPALHKNSLALILPGDMPLIQRESIELLLQTAAQNISGALLTSKHDCNLGYGRIQRDEQGAICKIIEEADASIKERTIREVNTGIMALPAARLARWLPRLQKKNAQQECYLTDVVAFASEEKSALATCTTRFDWEIQGVNTPAHLAAAERIHQRNQAEQWMEAGLQIADPERFDLRGKLQAGHDVRIDVGVILEGEVVLEENVQIGAYSTLRDVHIGSGTIIKSYSILEESRVGPDCVVGPYARLRPGTVLEAEVHVGNFVEVKKSHIGTGSKANHLSYIGDAEISTGVNIGAGVITCNYDGKKKHQTHIDKNAFIGSNASLVAPLKIGSGATIGAGSTITEDVGQNNLAIARSRQINKSQKSSGHQKANTKGLFTETENQGDPSITPAITPARAAAAAEKPASPHKTAQDKKKSSHKNKKTD